MDINRRLPNLSPDTAQDVAQAIRDAFNVLQDHIEAFRSVKTQIDAKPSATQVTSLAVSAAKSSIGTADLNMNGFRIINLGSPLNPQDAVNKAYVDQYAVVIGTHAQRLALPVTVGQWFLETDRTSLYIGELVSGSNSWVFVSGLYADLFANRPTNVSDLTVNDVGFLFAATNQNYVTWRWSGTAWVVQYGVMRGTLSPNQKPTLTADDAGFLFYSTDFDRTYRWSGTVWLDYNSASRGIFMCYEAPTTAGWQIADGSTVTRSKSDGTTASITVPDLVSDATKYSYFKTNSAYSSSVGAAVAPILAMNSYTPAGTNSIPTLTMNSYTPSGTVTAPTFTGSAETLTGSVAAPTFSGTPFSSIINHTHPVSSILTVQGGTTAATTGTHVMTSTATGGSARTVTAGDSIASTDSNPVGGVASITPAGTNSAPALSMNSYTPTGTVSTPTFTGSSATLTGSVTAPTFSGTSATLTGTIGTTGEPQHLNVLPYFRL